MIFLSLIICFILSTESYYYRSGGYDKTLYREEDCQRIRKPFHTLSESERMLYVNGFKALRENGKLEIISTAHAANVAVHKGSSFFFLHAYMVWEAETAIRELGGDYECFSMPYWDYTIDAGNERDPLIFHLNVGENGDPRNDFCMDDEIWGNTETYWSTDADTCMNDETRYPEPKCCLKRSVSDTQLLPNTMQIASVYLKNSNFLYFETQIDHYHVWPHFYLAVNTWSQMATAYAVDDPIFFLLHTFTLYQRALWTTCYEYDKINIDDLEKHHDAYTASCNPNMVDCGVVGVDAPYNLYPLDQMEWSLSYSMQITPKMLYDITDWNVKYDLGPFYMRSKLNEWCELRATHGDYTGPNPEWFDDITASNYKDYETQSDLQDYIDNKWNELKSKQDELDISDEEIYFAVESFSCKYHRYSSPNSCYDAEDSIIANSEYETCESRDIFDKELISLEDMLGFDGVKENECLQKRRQQLYSVSNLDDSILLKLCNGEYDYVCPEWTHPMIDEDEFIFNKDTKLIINNNSNYFDNNGYKYMTSISIIVFSIVSLCFIVKNWCFKNQNKMNESHDIMYGTF